MTKEQGIFEQYKDDLTKPWFYEAFVNTANGKLDYAYLVRTVGEDLSMVRLREALKHHNQGTEELHVCSNVVSEISREEFLNKYYECCKFVYVRDWIRFMWQEHGILLKRADLFEWVSKEHPEKLANYVNFTKWGDDVREHVSDD